MKEIKELRDGLLQTVIEKKRAEKKLFGFESDDSDEN